MDIPRALIIMDYQNVHLTAHNTWAPPGTPVHESLIHPLHYAEQVMAARKQNMRNERLAHAELAAVHVYRGNPSNAREPQMYAVNQAQKSEWERDPRVKVTYRSLRYPSRWPDAPAVEKGIDVLVALATVNAARERDYDVVILASHDTDLEPALEQAFSERRGRGQQVLETCGWRNMKKLRASHGGWSFHTFLDAAQMVASRDRRDYTGYYNAALPRQQWSR